MRRDIGLISSLNSLVLSILTLIRFLVFFLFVMRFRFRWTMVCILGNGGNFDSSSSIFSAARFFDIFLPLPSPSAVKLPTRHCVTNTFMCGGPFSLSTSNVTFRLRFKAISCTSDIGDFSSVLRSGELVASTGPACRHKHPQTYCFTFLNDRVSLSCQKCKLSRSTVADIDELAPKIP